MTHNTQGETQLLNQLILMKIDFRRFQKFIERRVRNLMMTTLLKV